MSEIPQDAIEAGARAIDLPYSEDWGPLIARRVLDAALPFLRSQWEKELLSDEAINRLQWYANSQSMDVCAYTVDDVRELLRAAIGEVL
jgi:hypothetical protein